MAIESETEAISIQFWLKGYILTGNYWMDGVMVRKKATYIFPSYVDTVWQWSLQSAYYYDYLKISAVSKIEGYNSYLHYNGSGPGYNGGHEYRSTIGSQIYNYICEAQGNFQYKNLSFLNYFIVI